jgi:hypothetical protein
MFKLRQFGAMSKGTKGQEPLEHKKEDTPTIARVICAQNYLLN